MSFDIFVARFVHGEVASFKRAIFEEVFGPYVVQREEHFVRVEFPDRSGADIYVDDKDELQGMMFNHCGGDAFDDRLVELVRRIEGVIYWPANERSSAITDTAILAHLPADFVATCGLPYLVSNRDELRDAIRGDEKILPIFVGRYVKGENAAFERGLVEEIFGGYVVEREGQVWHIRYPDGSTARVFLHDDAKIRSVMIYAYEGDAVFDGIFDLADRINGIIQLPGRKTTSAATNAAAIERLPSYFVQGTALPKLVRNRDELRDAIRNS